MNPLLLTAALAAIPVPVPPAAATPGAAVGPGITYEIRVVSMPGELPAAYRPNPGPVVLTDAQFRALLTDVQGTGGGVMQAPRLSVDDRQTARVFTGETRTFTTGIEAALKNGQVAIVPKTTPVEIGERFEITGRIEADRATVVARFKYTTSSAAASVPAVPVTVQHPGADGLQRVGVMVLEVPDVDVKSVEAIVTLPAGRHIVLQGPVRFVEERTEYRTPVLSDIPILSRAFTYVSVGRTAVRTYVVLTARVNDAPARPIAPAPRSVERD